MKTLEVVAGVFWQGDKFLIGRRRGDDSFAGKWEFPGGKIKPGESETEALKREIQEELGCEIDVGERLTEIDHTYETVQVKLIFYTCEFQGDLPKKSTSHQALAWITPEEINQYDFLEADRPFLEKLTF